MAVPPDPDSSRGTTRPLGTCAAGAAGTEFRGFDDRLRDRGLSVYSSVLSNAFGKPYSASQYSQSTIIGDRQPGTPKHDVVHV
jgi:hypothetical protein